MGSSGSSTEHAVAANKILTDARLLCETLATEFTEVNRKLSDALLDVVLYSEKVESMSRLLALADSCIGHIWARMRALGISIQSPFTSPNTITPSDSVSGRVISGALELETILMI